MVNKSQYILAEKTQALYRDGLKSTPFNIIIATFLMVILLLDPEFPVERIWIWWGIITAVSLVRWGLIYQGVRKKIWDVNEKSAFLWFAISTFITGLIWGLGYLIFAPFLTQLEKTYYIILIFGGLGSGALSSLAASYTCYYLYLFPMSLSIIFFHSLEIGIAGLVISSIFLGYTLFLMLIHRESHQLLIRNILLTHKKEELVKKIETANQKLRVANDHLKSISLIDGLTKVANRHYFKEIIKRDWEQNLKTQTSLAVLLIDIDYFKEYNDHYGHLKGDECLQEIANILKKNIKRQTDLVARYGGDEFIIVLDHTPLEGALTIANNILKDVEATKIKHEKSKISDYVTVSVGAACFTPKKEENFEVLISEADKALYNAKTKGRNNVSTARALH